MDKVPEGTAGAVLPSLAGLCLLPPAIPSDESLGNGLGGALVLELQASYVSTVETFPLTVPALVRFAALVMAASAALVAAVMAAAVGLMPV